MKKLDIFDWLIIAGCAYGCLLVMLKAIWKTGKQNEKQTTYQKVYQ